MFNLGQKHKVFMHKWVKGNTKRLDTIIIIYFTGSVQNNKVLT